MSRTKCSSRIGRPIHVTGIAWQKQQIWSYRFS